jgi:GNAT superfamily N-acetyltransferase
VRPQPPLHVVLRDGTRVVIRQIRPDDKDRLRRGMEEVSRETRYSRFHAHVDHLTDEQLAYLTEVDQRDHIAWVALDAAALDEPGIGVARCIRLPNEPTVAEAAVTVHDAYQGRGAGTLLLGVLGRAARDAGIETFRNYVLAENVAMVGLLLELGAEMVEDSDAGVLAIDLPIPDDPDDLPDTAAGRALKAAAAGRLRTLLSPFAPVRLPDESRIEVRRSEGEGGDAMFRAWLDDEFGHDDS